MKIVKLKAENIKKIKAIEISPTSNIVKITGKNAQGKTSILDSILYALGGAKYIPSKVLREGLKEGEKKGSIELDLGDLIVTRSFTETNSYLKVVTKEGAQFTKGQEKLTELIGNLSFDPLEFSSYEPKKQKEILIKLTGLDTSDLDSQYSEKYEARKEVGTMGKIAKGELESIEKPEDIEVKERINISETSQKLQDYRSEYDNAQIVNRQIRSISNEIEELEAKIKDLQSKYDELEQQTIRDEGEIYSDIEVYQKRLNEAESINAKIDTLERYENAESKVLEYKNQYNDITAELEGIQLDKLERIQKAKMPIKGLSIDGDVVTYNGIPFDQLSSAEKLKVSMAMAMAINPELKVIRIMDGSLLDSDNMKVIEEMVQDKDYQVWIEIVDESGQVGFFIEDGEVKGGEK